jgi:hypothetical protein
VTFAERWNMSRYLLAARVALAVFVAYLVIDMGRACAHAAGSEAAEQPVTITAQAPEPRARVSGTPAAVTLAPGEQVQVLTLEQWRAIQHIAPERQAALARIGWCESKFQADAVGDGGRSRGAWQVQERFWGPVPATLEGQARQADRIAAEHGLEPWTTAAGCEGWR